MTTVRAAASLLALRGPPVRAAIALALVISAVPAWPDSKDEDPEPRLRGRPLVQVLEELQLRGLNVIFSSEIVRPELVVADEPDARDPRAVLDQVLAPFSLQAKESASGAILVVPTESRPSGRMTGRVTAKPRGGPVGGATIAIEGTEIRVVTPRDGKFVLSDLPAGTYVLRVSAPGFLKRARPGVTVGDAETVDLEIPLEPDPRLVEEIVVIPGHHEIVPRELGAGRSLDVDDVAAAPTLGTDPSRIVALLPGIAASDGSATFNPRGSAAKDVSLVLDGLELYDPFHLSAFQSPFSIVDGRMVDSIAFLGGGFTADRGDRHGGFLDVTSLSPSDAASTDVEVGTLNSRVAHATPTPFGPLLVLGRYWYPDATASTTAFGKDGLRSTFGDLYVKLGLRSDADTTVSGHALLASDRAKLVEPDGNERVASSEGSGYLWFRVARSWSPTIATESVLSVGRVARWREGIAEPEDTPLDVRDDRSVSFIGAKNDATWRLGGSHVLRGGLDVHALEGNFAHSAGAAGSASALLVEQSGASIGAYVAYRTAITPRWVTEAGLRWDMQTYTGDEQWSPRLNLVWQAGPRSEVRLGAGRYAQSLRIHELRIEDGETTYRPPEISEQLDLMVVHRFAAPVGLRVDAYRHRLTQLQPRYENRFHTFELFPEVEPDRVLVAPESASLEGVEFSLRGDAGAPLQWRVNYTWSRAMDVVAGMEVPRSWDQTHAGNVLVAYRWRPGWFLSVNATIHTGWPITPVTGRTVTLPDGSTEIEPVLGPSNSARLPTYARLDLKTGRAFETVKGNVRVELSILNVTDRKNVCCVDEVQFQAGADGSVDAQTSLETWMGITPSLQVLWRF